MNNFIVKRENLLSDGYGITPNYWLYDVTIRKELALLIQISSLTAKDGICTASNEWLAVKLSVSLVTISRGISKLKSKNYIDVQYERRGAEVIKRKIRLSKLSFDDYQNRHSTVIKTDKEAVIKTDKDNSISNNSISNKSKSDFSPIPKVNKRENEITEALNFLQDNYQKRKITIDLTAHRKIVNACLNAFPLEEIKKGIMQTIGEKVGVIWKDGTNQEKHLKVSTIFAVKNMEKYISKADENGGVIISTDDVENILDIWIGLGRTPKTIYQERSPDYLVGLRNRIRDILNEGEKTKEDIIYMIKRAYTFSQHYHKLENILRDVKYMFEQFDKADKQIAQGTRERGKY